MGTINPIYLLDYETYADFIRMVYNRIAKGRGKEWQPDEL
jgi:hypothetical protein